MFGKRLLTLTMITVLLITLLLAGFVPAKAQDDMWSIYIYNMEGNQLVCVYADGTQVTYDIDLCRRCF